MERWRCVCFHTAPENISRDYLHSHLIWPGSAAAPLAGKDSFRPNGVEVFASQASEVDSERCISSPDGMMWSWLSNFFLISKLTDFPSEKNNNSLQLIIYTCDFTYAAAVWKIFPKKNPLLCGQVCIFCLTTVPPFMRINQRIAVDNISSDSQRDWTMET